MKKYMITATFIITMFFLSMATINAVNVESIMKTSKDITSITNTGAIVNQIVPNPAYNMGISEDKYGFIFNNVTPGIYKIAHYITLTDYTAGSQIRISPIVSKSGEEQRRCWIDHRWNEDNDGAYKNAGSPEKIVIISVINVPEGYNRIDAGFWQDKNAFYGTLDKIVLANAQYDFEDGSDYFIFSERNYGNETPNEDPGRLLFANKKDWVTSGAQSSHKEGLKAQFFVPKNYAGDPQFNDISSLYNLTRNKKFSAFNWDRVIKIGEGIVPTVGIKGAGEISGAWDFREVYHSYGGVGDDAIIVKMTGFIYSKTGGNYRLSSKYYDNGIVIFVDGQNIFEIWDQNAGTAGVDVQGNNSGIWADNGEEKYRKWAERKFTLDADKRVPFEAYYIEMGGGECLRLDVEVDGQAGYRTWEQAGLKFFVTESKSVYEPVSTPTQRNNNVVYNSQTSGGVTPQPSSGRISSPGTHISDVEVTKSIEISNEIQITDTPQIIDTQPTYVTQTNSKTNSHDSQSLPPERDEHSGGNIITNIIIVAAILLIIASSASGIVIFNKKRKIK